MHISFDRNKQILCVRVYKEIKQYYILMELAWELYGKKIRFSFSSPKIEDVLKLYHKWILG